MLLAIELLATIEDWSRALESGEQLDVAYCDFSKAFDSVPHRRLLNKLKAHGIRGHVLDWVEDFLTGRQQRVAVEGNHSRWSLVKSGVPQGSVLGPLLFLVYVNDLPTVVQCQAKLFADDTKVYCSGRDGAMRPLLQDDLDTLVQWSDRWQLPFNEAKCKAFHVGSDTPDYAYFMRGIQLEWSLVEKDLGVHVDSDLKYRKQASEAVSKASRVLAVIKRSFALIDRTTLPLLYKALVRPHLEYGNLVWGPHNSADQQLVERVQRRATRAVPDLRDRPYQDRLRALELPSLYHRRRRGDVIFAYQLFHEGVDMDPETFFQLAPDSATRGHPWKLQKPHASTRVRRHFFAARVINDWNALPLRVVSAENANQFKARLDKHWARCMYDVPIEDG